MCFEGSQAYSADRPSLTVYYHDYHDYQTCTDLQHFNLTDLLSILGHAIRFYPPSNEVGAGISVASDVRLSGVRIFVSGAELCNPSMDFSNFLHTHP